LSFGAAHITPSAMSGSCRLFGLSVVLSAMLCLPSSVPAEDAAKPGAGEIQDLKQVPAALPHDVMLGLLNNAGKQAAASKGTETLRAKVEGQMATLKFKIDKIEKDDRRGQEEPYRIKAEDAHVRESAVNFKVYLWVHFKLSENAKVAAMKKGGEVSATGKVTVAAVSVLNGNPQINVDISDATVN
jgi:RecG-like helicase